MNIIIDLSSNETIKKNVNNTRGRNRKRLKSAEAARLKGSWW